MSAYKDFSFNELKAKCKELGISYTNTDTKAMLLAKLDSYQDIKVAKAGTRAEVIEKLEDTVEVMVTPRNPDERREDITFTIQNATGVYRYPIVFGKKIILPKPVVEALKEQEYQAFKRVNHPVLGMYDAPYLDKAFNVAILK
jgi:hypothetical protein